MLAWHEWEYPWPGPPGVIIIETRQRWSLSSLVVSAGRWPAITYSYCTYQYMQLVIQQQSSACLWFVQDTPCCLLQCRI